MSTRAANSYPQTSCLLSSLLFYEISHKPDRQTHVVPADIKLPLSREAFVVYGVKILGAVTDRPLHCVREKAALFTVVRSKISSRQAVS